MSLEFLARLIIWFAHKILIVNFYATILCRHLRVGSWVLVWGTTMFIGASCILVEVALLLLPCP